LQRRLDLCGIYTSHGDDDRVIKRRILILLARAGAHGRNLIDDIQALRDADLPYEQLSRAEASKRFPQINFEGRESMIFEKFAGYLTSRRACEVVCEAFVKEGGHYRGLAAQPGPISQNAMQRLTLSDGSALSADHYVFACGPWLGKLFPQTIGDRIVATKQDIFFFGAPAGDSRFTDGHMPVWADHRGRFRYGIPGNDRRGFKIADDTRGPAFDPSNGERVVSPETLKDIREYIAFRFPALKDAPLVETRVCQYEQTRDAGFIVDRHPSNENVWLLGGGSGHGFKHGPAVGEMMADLILKDREPGAIWKLDRFNTE